MRRNKGQLIVSSLLFAIFAVVSIKAGGPLFMWNAEQRIPYRWDVSTPVPVYTDNGPFEIIPPTAGTPISNETADAAVAFSIAQWSDVATSSFRAEIAGDFASIGLPDINSPANAGLVMGTDNGGGIHIIYDADGTIMRNYLGVPSNVLGVAMPEWADEETGTITESWVIANSQLRWVGDNQLQNFRAIFTHEFGHAINLAHSQTNGALRQFNDARGPASCSATLPYAANTFTISHLETMYPFLNVVPATGVGIQMATVDIADDKVSVSNLYPAPGYAENHGSITGRVLETDGTKGITGINVIARNLDDPFADAVSAMSGDYVRVSTNDDGTFTINGLTPGARYVIYNDMIVGGGFPTVQPLFMPEGEEFSNGVNESGNGITDDRCSYQEFVAAPGSVAQGNIVLNSVKGAPKFTPLVTGVTANSISSDGSIIGGVINTGGVFRYTEEEGGLALVSTANALNGTMSRDGSFFVSDTLNTANKRVASILQYPGGPGWLQLPVPQIAPPATATPSDYVSTAWGVAENGQVVAGGVQVDTNGPLPGEGSRVRPFIWTPEDGSQVLPVPAGTRNARPNGISADGSTVLGWYDFPTSGNVRSAARWVNGEFLPFNMAGEAFNSTPDGSVIVGANGGPNRDAWYWSEETGVQFLGRLGALGSASANAISDDAKVIAGFGGNTAQFPNDVSGHRAFLWTPELGFADLENFLHAQGTYTEGWIVNSVNDMTPDGNIFVGSGYSPRGIAGWTIDLRKVNICHAPPGNPRAKQTLNIDFRRSMGDHLKHGDTIGVCTQ